MLIFEHMFIFDDQEQKNEGYQEIEQASSETAIRSIRIQSNRDQTDEERKTRNDKSKDNQRRNPFLESDHPYSYEERKQRKDDGQEDIDQDTYSDTDSQTEHESQTGQGDQERENADDSGNERYPPDNDEYRLEIRLKIAIDVIEEFRSKDILDECVIHEGGDHRFFHDFLHIMIDFFFHSIQSGFFAKMFFLLSTFHE